MEAVSVVVIPSHSESGPKTTSEMTKRPTSVLRGTVDDYKAIKMNRLNLFI